MTAEDRETDGRRSGAAGRLRTQHLSPTAWSTDGTSVGGREGGHTRLVRFWSWPAVLTGPAGARRGPETTQARACQAASLPDKRALQKRIKQTESSRDEAWRAYDAQVRKIEEAKETLIDDVEARRATDQTLERVMTLRFIVT